MVYKTLLFFSKYLKVNLRSISSEYFLALAKRIIKELFSCKQNFFRNSLFPSTVIEWNNLDLKIRISETFLSLKKIILKWNNLDFEIRNSETFSAFKKSIFKWNNLDLKIRYSETFSAFKKSILKFIRAFSNPIFNCHSPNGIKLITTINDKILPLPPIQCCEAIR